MVKDTPETRGQATPMGTIPFTKGEPIAEDLSGAVAEDRAMPSTQESRVTGHTLGLCRWAQEGRLPRLPAALVVAPSALLPTLCSTTARSQSMVATVRASAAALVAVEAVDPAALCC